MRYRVSADADPAMGFTVNLIRCWARGELTLRMSASSGPKDYLSNQICAVFDRFPGIARVLMLRGEYSDIGKDRHASPAFLLCENELGELFDMAGELVQLRRIAA